MKYAAVFRDFISRDPALSASDAAIGAWTRLAVAAADREEVAVDLEAAVDNGSISERAPLGEALIRGCLKWTDRQWLSTCGVDLPGVSAATDAGLCRWAGDDLLVAGADLFGLYRVRQARLNGRAGGRPPSQKPRGSASDNPRVSRRRREANRSGNPVGNPSPLPASPYLAQPDTTETDRGAPASRATPPEPGLVFPTVRGARGGAPEWNLTASSLRLLSEGFPDLDVLAEAKKARVWLLANPAKKKTADGMLAFLNAWLTRAQNGSARYPKAASNGGDVRIGHVRAEDMRHDPPGEVPL